MLDQDSFSFVLSPPSTMPSVFAPPGFLASARKISQSRKQLLLSGERYSLSETSIDCSHTREFTGARIRFFGAMDTVVGSTSREKSLAKEDSTVFDVSFALAAQRPTVNLSAVSIRTYPLKLWNLPP